jgi:hypothetical protein
MNPRFFARETSRGDRDSHLEAGSKKENEVNHHDAESARAEKKTGAKKNNYDTANAVGRIRTPSPSFHFPSIPN